MQIAGKRVLITGAGNGLGRELALAFSDADAEVIVTDIDSESVTKTAELVQAAGGTTICLSADVTDVDSVMEIRSQLHRLHGPIDVLVNNAGTVCGGAFLDVSIAAHRTTMEVNALGPLIVTHVFLPDLIARAEAHCVNIVSAAGMIAMPYGAAYAASKWAALGLSDSIREELRSAGHRHVGVTAVCPGLLDTELFAASRQPRLMPRLNAAGLAKQIVRAVKTNKKYLLTPWLAKIIPISNATLPLCIRQRIFDWLGVTTMHQRLGQPRKTSAVRPEGSPALFPATEPQVNQ